ncbi:putative uncharacterized protein C7orf78 homolog isoform X2 [Emydura macquarii macquarii]|uniref:putative uncharacterized protein C7orf78 homolog isoform X2 n=1 Tax=Emydura macquarii macquarii TaxID=1129001 RepID=UPI00352B3D3E
MKLARDTRLYRVGLKYLRVENPTMLTTSCKGKQPTFSFERRIKFSAHLDLAFAQNQSFVQQLRATTQTDIWQKQPPDFSYKLYKSSRPPRKPPGKLKEELKKVNSTESETKQQLPRIKIGQFHPTLERKKELPKLVTRFPRVGSYEAEIMFVENGKYKTGMYQDPKPHDFRQYETNIPDFVTSYPRDPFNLKFKSQHLNAVHGLQPLKDKQKDTKRRFITYKPHECKWESGLILPKNPWPPKSASFTRHRRRRGAHTAFLDRVDEKLRTIWQEEVCYPVKEVY